MLFPRERKIKIRGHHMANEKAIDENQIKLYGILVDQLQKYNTIIWQIPTALVAANFLAIDKFHSNSPLLLALSLFNASLIYVFQRMIAQQRAIIKATKSAEAKIKNRYATFIPTFPSKVVPAPKIFLCVIWLLNTVLLLYSVIGILCQLPCTFYVLHKIFCAP